MKKYQERFSKNTLIVVFIIFTLIILGLEYSLYYFESNRIVDEELKNLSSVAALEEKNVISWLNEINERGQILSSSRNLNNLILSFVKNPTNSNLILQMEDFFESEIAEKKYVAAFICDSLGNTLFSYKNYRYQIRPSSKTELYRVTEGNPSILTNIESLDDIKTEAQIPALEFIIGIFPSKLDRTSHKVFLVFIINARNDLFKLLNTWVYEKSTSESMLLGIDKDEIIYLNDLRYIYNLPLQLRAKIGAEEIPGKRISTAQKGVFEGIDYRGEKVIASTAFIPQMNWYLVIKVDKKEILSNANKILFILAGSIILILFLFIVLLGVLWKREDIEKLRKDLEIQRTQAILSQKYQIVSKYANDAFILLNKDGRIVEANDKTVEMYGYNHQELKNMPVIMLHAPEARDEVKDVMEKIKSSGGMVYETVHIHKNGTKFHVEISAKIIAIKEEIFFIGIYRNIEDRKKVELELKESEKKFHALFEHANDAILIMKKDSIIDCNNKTLQMFNCNKDVILGKRIGDISPEFQPDSQKSKEKFLLNIKEALEGSSAIYEWQYKKFDSTTFDCEVSLNPVILKGETYLQAIVRDVTEKKKSLDQMRKLTNAIQNTEEMMMITDNQGWIEYVNPAFEKITGFKFTEAVGKKPNILKSGKQPNEVYKNLWDTILSGNSWSGILVNKKKSGDLYTEEIMISPIKNEKGNIISFVALKKDVTERIKAEEELKKARIKAEESDRIKSNFLSMMSHEVRTPLNVILGFMDMIKSSVSSDMFPEKDHFFEMINRNSKRLMTLIGDIIDISRIESNEMRLNYVCKNLQSLLMHVTADHEMEARAKGLKIKEKYDAENIFVRVDEVRFNQILSNLMTNAIKFTLRGEITVSLKAENNTVHISVKDTGIGIPPEFRPHLFEFFRQAEEGYNRNFEGAGLGLAITYKLVKLMGGDLSVESHVGKGSTFTVSLPIVDPALFEKEVEEPVVEEKIEEIDFGKEPTVLIVEDNKDNSYFVEVILNKLGINYYSAVDANEAFDLLKRFRFDLILMDISLVSSMSGEAALKILKTKDEYKNIPTIAMTAHAMLGDRDHFISAGFDEYLSKPFTVEELSKLLFTYLRDKMRN